MDIDAVCKRLEHARSKRANWDTIFQEIADRVLPYASDFKTRREDGARRTELMFDATASLSLNKFAAAIETYFTPRAQEWHKLKISGFAGKDLEKSYTVKAWMDEANRRLFGARYSPRSAFSSNAGEAYLAFGAFGTAPLFVDDDVERRCLRYKSLPLASTWVLENAHGRIDTVFRKLPYTLRMIEQRWPGKLPHKLAERLKANKDEDCEVTHAIMPADDYEPGHPTRKGMPWYSCYFIASDKAILDEGGYHSWPVPCARYITTAGEVYGRSPVWMVLPNIKVLNEQKKTVLKAGHRAVDPPLLASEDGVLSAFSMQPGAINYGGLDSQGRAMVTPLMTNPRVDIGKDLMDDERRIISEACLIDLFRVLAENPQMTATQTMELVNERASLMAPVGGRLNSEWHGPMIERELDLLMRANQLPPMPPELIEAHGEYEIEYTSPMTRAARASDGIAIMRTMEQILPLAQYDKSVMYVFKANEVARELAEINGMPAKTLNSPEEVEALLSQQGQEMQAQQMIQAAPAVSDAAANLAKLQQSYGAPAR